MPDLDSRPGGAKQCPEGADVVDVARADGMQSILHNPIQKLETTSTGCYAEAQTTCDLEETHDPGRIRCFPLDRAAIRQQACGVIEGQTQRPDC